MRHLLSPAQRRVSTQAARVKGMLDALRERTGVSSWLISSSTIDIIVAMKQLLLRVPDMLHRQLAHRAAKEKRSVNAVATEILDSAVGAAEGDRRARLRARARALGIARGAPAKRITAARRRRVVASTRGTGPVLDDLLTDERGHL